MKPFTVIGRVSDEENDFYHVVAKTPRAARRAGARDIRAMRRSAGGRGAIEVHIDWIFEGHLNPVGGDNALYNET